MNFRNLKLLACLLVAQLAVSSTGAELMLVPNWTGDLNKGGLKMTDVYKVIGQRGTPAVDTSQQAITIYNDITYLMPLEDALKAIQKTVGSKKVVTCPGFPTGTFFYYSFDGIYGEEGCNKILIVTDGKDQVVAVQLVKETPKKIVLSGHSSEFGLYNFIETTAKAAPSWAIAHKPRLRGKLLDLQSEVLDSNGKPREYVRLFLPVPIMNLVSISSDPVEARKYASVKPAATVAPAQATPAPANTSRFTYADEHLGISAIPARSQATTYRIAVKQLGTQPVLRIFAKPAGTRSWGDIFIASPSGKKIRAYQWDAAELLKQPEVATTGGLFRVVEIPMGHFITAAGDYEVIFNYSKGKNELVTGRVEIESR